MIVENELKYNRYEPLPASELNTQVFVYSKQTLQETPHGDLIGPSIGNPTIDFWANVSSILDTKGRNVAGNASLEKTIEIIARKDDCFIPGGFQIKIDDLIAIDLSTNEKYSIHSIMREEYRYGVIIYASLARP